MRFIMALLAALGLAKPAPGQMQSDEIEAFFKLVQRGDVAGIEAALNAHPHLATARDRFEFQPIHVLDYANFEAVLAVLMRHGADINAVNDEGIALLHILIDSEFLPAVLAAGADIEQRDNLGRTPLLVHIEEPDSLDMVTALLDAGADVNARDEGGRSALTFAVLSENEDLAVMLQQAGAVD